MTATLELPPLTTATVNIEDIRQVVRRHWGFDSFRPLQLEAIESALNNRDSVVAVFGRSWSACASCCKRRATSQTTTRWT